VGLADLADLCTGLQRVWGSAPDVFQAPGRVNLIGEHTDYNDGFVLPAAIQLQTRAAIAPAPGRQVFVESTAYSDKAEFVLDDPQPASRKHWSDYVRATAWSLEREGVPLKGARLFIDSDIPPGAGLSSSAAIEVASAYAFLSNAGVELAPAEIVKVCHRAENEFIGIRSGIMDQFASCHGRSGHALLLDCRSLKVRYIAVPRDIVLMVCNTMVRHELASGEYNARRQQCEDGVAVLSRFIPDIRALRDVSREQLARFNAELDPVIHRRCRHVVEENRRVLLGAEALASGNAGAFGALMQASHQSLRLDYEVSCPELDLMCELALGVKGVYGARMMGGGFGGCVLTLADASVSETFRPAVAAEYRRRTGIDCEIYECFPADGAGPLSIGNHHGV
jgi:galactokinase